MPAGTITFQPGWLTFLDTLLPANAATLNPVQIPYIPSPKHSDVPLLHSPSDFSTIPNAFASNHAALLALSRFNATLLLARIRKSILELKDSDADWHSRLEQTLNLSSIRECFPSMPSDLLDPCDSAAVRLNNAIKWIIAQAKRSAGATALKTIEEQLKDEGSYHESVKRYLNARTLKPELPDLNDLRRETSMARTSLGNHQAMYLAWAEASRRRLKALSMVLAQHGTLGPEYVESLVRGTWTEEEGKEVVQAIVDFWEGRKMSDERRKALVEGREVMKVFKRDVREMMV